MFLSGIADEAAKDLNGQIRAHKELGWTHIECRNVDGTNLTDLSDEEFARTRDALGEAGLQVSCFASQIANWARPIDNDLEVDIAELETAIPRMHEMTTPFIRCMSYPNAKDPLDEADWRREAIRRMKELARIAEDGGVTLVHENCSGWGGMGPAQSMDLITEVDSPALKLVFDTGNPAQYNQDAWEYYTATKSATVYVHIKDYEGTKADCGGEERACYPGDGVGHVREILSDLFANGYDGGISIEPHITSVVHLSQEASDPQAAFRTYVEYGRRLEKLVNEIRQ